MSIIICHECGKEMSNAAKSCPNCGAPNKIVSENKKDGAKLIVFVVVALVLISAAIVWYASQNPDIDKTTYNLGKQAIEITDDYLDGIISGGEARHKLDNVHERLKNNDDTETLLVSIDITLISSGIFLGEPDTEIVARRNKLAEKLKIKKR